MRKKIFFGAFISLFLAGSIYWFFYTKKVATPVAPGITAIPTDAAFIVESKKSFETWKKLSQTNIMWEELLGTATVANIDKQANFIDSILNTDPLILPLLEDHSVLMSAHLNEKGSYDLLFVYSLPNLTYKGQAEQFLEKINRKEIIYSEFENEKTGAIKIPGKPVLNFCIASGILIMSSNAELMHASVHQLNSKTNLSGNKSFKTVLDAAGKNVDANFYINYKLLPELFTGSIRKESKSDLSSLKHFADYSGWDITLKPNALMLNGFTSSDDSASNYLNIFREQKPQHIDVTEIIPSETAYLMYFGISNMEAFQREHEKYLKANSLWSGKKNFQDTLEHKYHSTFETEMLSWPGNEMALVITEPGSDNQSENTYAVFQTNDILNAQNILYSLSDTCDLYNNEKTDTTSFRNHVIDRLNIPGLLKNTYGSQFKNVNGGYFTSIADYIVFGNSDIALQRFITNYEGNKTLSNNKNYQAFAENISEEASIYIYSAIARSTNLYKGAVTDQIRKDIDSKLPIFQKFESAGIQFSYNSDELFYSNIYLKYNPEYKQEAGTLWETQLDTTVSPKPFLLTNHNNKSKDVLIQDNANKLYFISNTGKIIWTKQLSERIMSDVIQVDVLKNNKLQMIFNTRSSIYMYDRNGNEMNGFPINLKSPATNALSVIDYEGNRDYRIFIACENKKILCFKSNGESVTGFKEPSTTNTVFLPLQYFKSNAKDHLCVIDQQGKIYIMDRHGETRVKIKEQLPQGIRNFFIEAGKDYRNTYITSSDTLGNIIRMNLSGELERSKFQDFEATPYFEYCDINNDKTKEYIFLTRKELKVFNADKTLLFNHSFDSDVLQSPQLFAFPDGLVRIGITSETSNELYLFNSNGSLYDQFPLKGKTQFGIGDLNNEGAYNLVTGSEDNSVYMYQLK
ncbi:MAG: hypothetical protein K0Q95_1169 [Bacteroidota bacterium]|jgi:hypothetical protein|nr:hypothetical protein [Bacteroidota bacterium]